MLRPLKDDSGAVAVVVALTLTVILGVAALAVDAGYLYSVRRQLQTAADAAALAGCRVMLEQQVEDANQILLEAEEYAEVENGVRPADGAVMGWDAPGTVVDFNERSVQVTVTKQSSLFFARIFGRSDTPVVATSKARVAYITGLRGVMPWAVPIINANRVTVRIGAGPELDLSLSDADAKIWSGTVPVPLSGDPVKPITVTAYNGQTAYPDGSANGYPTGIPEVAGGAAAVVVRAPSAAIQDVSVRNAAGDLQYVATAGVDSTMRLRVIASAQPSARFDGRNYTLSLVSGYLDRWEVSLPVPVSDSLFARYPIDVQAGSTSWSNAAVLIVRRGTYPILDVRPQTPYVVTNTGGGYGSLTVQVQLHDFIYGREYELKVVGGGSEVGNFCAVDLATLKHAPNWANPQHPSEYDLTTDPDFATPAYYHYLAYELPFDVHIGDTIWTETGVLSGPTTDRALNERFLGNVMSFDAWAFLNRPASSRVVYLPIVEKVQPVTGQTPLRIVSFGAFYIDPGSDIKHDTIVGRFIEKAAPADGLSDTKPDELYVETVRLVTPN